MREGRWRKHFLFQSRDKASHLKHSCFLENVENTLMAISITWELPFFPYLIHWKTLHCLLELVFLSLWGCGEYGPCLLTKHQYTFECKQFQIQLTVASWSLKSLLQERRGVRLRGKLTSPAPHILRPHCWAEVSSACVFTKCGAVLEPWWQPLSLICAFAEPFKGSLPVSFLYTS